MKSGSEGAIPISTRKQRRKTASFRLPRQKSATLKLAYTKKRKKSKDKEKDKEKDKTKNKQKDEAEGRKLGRVSTLTISRKSKSKDTNNSSNSNTNKEKVRKKIMSPRRNLKDTAMLLPHPESSVGRLRYEADSGDEDIVRKKSSTFSHVDVGGGSGEGKTGSGGAMAGSRSSCDGICFSSSTKKVSPSPVLSSQPPEHTLPSSPLHVGASHELPKPLLREGPVGDSSISFLTPPYEDPVLEPPPSPHLDRSLDGGGDLPRLDPSLPYNPIPDDDSLHDVPLVRNSNNTACSFGGVDHRKERPNLEKAEVCHTTKNDLGTNAEPSLAGKDDQQQHSSDFPCLIIPTPLINFPSNHDDPINSDNSKNNETHKNTENNSKEDERTENSQENNKNNKKTAKKNNNLLKAPDLPPDCPQAVLAASQLLHNVNTNPVHSSAHPNFHDTTDIDQLAKDIDSIGVNSCIFNNSLKNSGAFADNKDIDDNDASKSCGGDGKQNSNNDNNDESNNGDGGDKLNNNNNNNNNNNYSNANSNSNNGDVGKVVNSADTDYTGVFELTLVVELRDVVNDSTGAAEVCPKVRYRYPALTRKMTNEEAKLQTFIMGFCFPDISGDASSARKMKDLGTFNFALTESSGKRKWGYCTRIIPKGSINPICFCIVSTQPCYTVFSSILYHTVSLFPSIKGMTSFLSEMHTASLPPPGGTFGPAEYNIVRPHNNDMLVRQFNLGPLIHLLSPDVLYSMFVCMLIERRIIFIADKLTTLSSVVQASVSLLYPLEWQHIFISVLPQTLLNFCEAPMPFVIGILRTSVNILKKRAQGLSEVVFIDIDNNKVISTTKEEDDNLLPESLRITFLSRLEKLADSIKNTKKKKRLGNARTPREIGTSGSNKYFISEIDQKDLSNVFIAVMVEILDEYWKFQNEDSFNRLDFVDNHPPPLRPFLDIFSQCQLFNFFVQSRRQSRERRESEESSDGETPDKKTTRSRFTLYERGDLPKADVARSIREFGFFAEERDSFDDILHKRSRTKKKGIFKKSIKEDGSSSDTENSDLSEGENESSPTRNKAPKRIFRMLSKKHLNNTIRKFEEDTEDSDEKSTKGKNVRMRSMSDSEKDESRSGTRIFYETMSSPKTQRVKKDNALSFSQGAFSISIDKTLGRKKEKSKSSAPLSLTQNEMEIDTKLSKKERREKYRTKSSSGLTYNNRLSSYSKSKSCENLKMSLEKTPSEDELSGTMKFYTHLGATEAEVSSPPVKHKKNVREVFEANAPDDTQKETTEELSQRTKIMQMFNQKEKKPIEKTVVDPTPTTEKEDIISGVVFVQTPPKTTEANQSQSSSMVWKNQYVELTRRALKVYLTDTRTTILHIIQVTDLVMVKLIQQPNDASILVVDYQHKPETSKFTYLKRNEAPSAISNNKLIFSAPSYEESERWLIEMLRLGVICQIVPDHK